MRVPESPEAPPGDPDSVVSFRAAPKYLTYKTVVWALGQSAALLGILAGFFLPLWLEGDLPGFGGSLGVFGILASGALFLFLPQAALSYAVLHLDYDLRWYILTDRALRIREGVLVVREQTLTFANIQEIEIKRNPIHRMLGLSDVEVRTAGGGSRRPGSQKGGQETHRGVLRGVADGAGIRDRIRERVKRYRTAGLGDPDDRDGVGRPEETRPGTPMESASHRDRRDVTEAARELAREVRGLRHHLRALPPRSPETPSRTRSSTD